MTYVLDPSLPFTQLTATLLQLGFVRDDSVRAVTPNLIAGEPELASWSRAEARLTYTFNPVVALRVLVPFGVGETGLQDLERCVPHLDVAAVSRLLAQPEPKQLLLGLFAARTLLTQSLRERVAELGSHPEAHVAQATQDTLHALDEAAERAARSRTLQMLDLVCQQAVPVLAALVDREAAQVVEQLRPHSDDYGRVFQAQYADLIRQSYDALWREPPRVEPHVQGDVQLSVFACPAGMFGTENELSRRFPGGYLRLAPYMQTDRIWLAWRYAPALGQRVRYDGLVRIGERWVWFPKPYRVVGAVLSNLPPS